MTRTILYASIVSITMMSLVIAPTASADKVVPDWVKNNAVWWAQNLITEQEFLTVIEYLINEDIIKLAQAQETNQATIDDLWAAINELQVQVEALQNSTATAGPQGEQGPPGTGLSKADYYMVSDVVSVAAGALESTQINCNAGDIPVDAGFFNGASNREIIAQIFNPIDEFSSFGGPPDQYRFQFNNIGVLDGSVTAVVTCLDIPE